LQTKETFGYELFGYWEVLASPDAEEFLMSHFDSFFSILYPADEKLWIPHLASKDGLRAWLESDQTTDPATYFSEEVRVQRLRSLIYWLTNYL
jgi:soluble epoxide hydrolase / lipid-phosphate phosphatase